MFKKLLLTGLGWLPVCLFAQTVIIKDGFGLGGEQKLKAPEPIIGEVLYDFTYISDTTQPGKMQKEILVLDFGNDYSKFYSQTFKISDSLMKADFARQIKEQEGQTNLNFTARPLEGNSDVFLANKKTETVSSLRNFGRKQYLVTDGKNTIDWDIQDSTKTIGGYTC